MSMQLRQNLRRISLTLPLLIGFAAGGMPIYASSQSTGEPTGEPTAAPTEPAIDPQSSEPEAESQPARQAAQSEREDVCDEYQVVRDRSDHEAPILPRRSIAARAIQTPRCQGSAQSDP